MLDDILFALWFFAPAGAANLTPVIIAKAPLLRHWNQPLDFGRSYRGRRIFGNHKTWRGLISGLIAGALTVWLQAGLYGQHQVIRDLSPLDYASVSILGLGLLLGFGALAGDAIKSFFKRQIGVPAGTSWFPFDQLDYIAGGLLLSAIVAPLGAIHYIWIVLIWFGAHLLSSYVGYLLKFKDRPI